MRPGVDVDVGGRLGVGCVTGVGRQDLRVGEERGLAGDGGELGGELTERQVLGPVADQAERGRVPEGRGAAVAEDDLVAVGQAEQRVETFPDPLDQGLHRRLTVRRTHHRRARTGQRGERLRADLGRSAAESAVGGQHRGGQGQSGSIGHDGAFSSQGGRRRPLPRR